MRYYVDQSLSATKLYTSIRDILSDTETLSGYWLTCVIYLKPEGWMEVRRLLDNVGHSIQKIVNEICQWRSREVWFVKRGHLWFRTTKTMSMYLFLLFHGNVSDGAVNNFEGTMIVILIKNSQIWVYTRNLLRNRSKDLRQRSNSLRKRSDALRATTEFE